MRGTVGAGSPARLGLGAYVLLSESHGASGTGTVAGRDNDSGRRRDARPAGQVPGAGTVTRSGTLAAGYVSQVKGEAQQPFWSRRYSLYVSAASTATVSAPSAADVFVYVLPGTDDRLVVEGSDDDSGPDSDAGVAVVALAAGVLYTVEVTTSVATDGHGVSRSWVSSRGRIRVVLVYFQRGGAADVTVTCTAPDHSPGTDEALFSDGPRPQVGDVTAKFAPADACTATTAQGADAAHSCTLAEGGSLAVTLTATVDSAAIAANWDTTGGATVAPGSVRAATPVIGPDSAATGDWQRTATATLACTGDGAAAATITAGRHPADDTHTTRIGIDCKQQVRISGLDDATGYSAAGTKAAVSGAFTVDPATADCTAAPTGTVTAPDTRRPHERLLSAQIPVGTTTTITVTCTDTSHADGTASAVLSGVAADCDDALGSLVHDVTVTRDGTVAANAGCTSAGRGLSGTFYARRHTFTLDAAARVSVDLAAASEAAPLDAYVVLYRGLDAAAAAVLHSDDNSGPGSDSRLRSLRLGAGDYTIEATTATAGAVGGYRLGVRAVYGSPVRISGLADDSGAGTGAVTVSEPFTVSPSTAACTAAPDAASVTAGSGRRRTVTATIDAPGPLPVTVTCTAAGRGPARQQATLTHAGALTTITARAVTSGGECETARTRRGVDAAYRCRIGRGNTVTIAADAVATGPGVEIAWNITGAVTATGHQTDAATPTFGPDNSIAAWKRTATVDLACTANGTATAKATLAGTTAKKTARLTVVCADAVQIAGLEDASAEGTGTVAVTRSFTVTPSTAECSADPAAAGVTEGVGGARTLSAPVAVPATLETVVTCKADGYADAVRRVALTARRPCSTHLGKLSTGTVTLSGTIADDGCVAKARRTATESVFYAPARHWAKRHTFTLDTPGWVTISLDSAPANADPLDTYLILLKDDGNRGTPVERNDNRRSSIKNARLTGIFLRPGSYTIEATSKRPQVAGVYDLEIEAIESQLQDSYTATVGTAKPVTFHYWPPGAQVAVKSAANKELQPSIAAARTVTNGVMHGTATITLTPRLVHTHEDLTVRVRHNTATEQLLGPVTLTAECPSGEKPSINNNVLCLPNSVTQNDESGSAHRVTPGTLNGILASAEAALAARSDRDRCGLTVNRLAAFMLSIGYHELIGGTAAPAPSPMYPGRSDIYVPTSNLRKLNRYNYVNDAEKYIRTKKTGTGVWDEPRRAFYHPGVGWWQIDDISPWRGLNQGQRVDTGLGLNGIYDSQGQDSGGEVVAGELADRYCDHGLSGLKASLNNMWVACRKDNIPDRCYVTSQKIFISYAGDRDDLHVAIAAGNRGQYSTSGGVSAHRCRWSDNRLPLPQRCFFYDTEHPEGWADLRDKWGYDTWRSPLAVPFIALSYGETRMAVFPGPILTALKPADHPTAGAFTTWTKVVPRDVDVRDAGEGGWSSGKYDRLGTPNDDSDDSALEVEFCDDADWVLPTGARRRCTWLSVDGAAFARRLGYSTWPAGVT